MEFILNFPMEIIQKLNSPKINVAKLMNEDNKVDEPFSRRDREVSIPLNQTFSDYSSNLK